MLYCKLHASSCTYPKFVEQAHHNVQQDDFALYQPLAISSWDDQHFPQSCSDWVKCSPLPSDKSITAQSYSLVKSGLNMASLSLVTSSRKDPIADSSTRLTS
jgi:hypothetical protein